MSTTSAATHNLFGLIELDHSGTILFSRLDGDAGRASSADLCGSNFYTAVAPFANVEEFRERLARFEQGGNPAKSFMFDCRFADGEVVPVRVLLARMRQRTDGGPSESVLMHIRKL